MRGIPGCGKTTTARKLATRENIFSTDDFWGPEYNWDPNKLTQAHSWNQNRAFAAMDKGVTPIVIDNCNLSWKAIEPYAEHAFQLGYTVEFKESEMPEWLQIVSRLNKRVYDQKDAAFLTKNGTHNVPESSTLRMMRQWSPTDQMEKMLNYIRFK